MSILAVGSIAFDSIATPAGRAENVVGGSATYFSLAASYFTEVRVVAVVGEDFTAEHENILKKRGVDTRGIEHAKGKTFRWGGHYLEFERSQDGLHGTQRLREIPAAHSPGLQRFEFLFLGNIHPSLQRAVRLEMDKVQLTGGDTMNYWIQGSRPELTETLKVGGCASNQ